MTKRKLDYVFDAGTYYKNRLRCTIEERKAKEKEKEKEERNETR